MNCGISSSWIVPHDKSLFGDAERDFTGLFKSEYCYSLHPLEICRLFLLLHTLAVDLLSLNFQMVFKMLQHAYYVQPREYFFQYEILPTVRINHCQCQFISLLQCILDCWMREKLSHLQKWICHNQVCSQAIFISETEALQGNTQPYAEHSCPPQAGTALWS